MTPFVLSVGLMSSSVLLSALAVASPRTQEPVTQKPLTEQPQPEKPSPRTVNWFVQQLSSADPNDQIDAAVQLGSMGPYAQSAVRPLTGLLTASRPALQYESLVALGRIGPMAYDSSDAVAAFLSSSSIELQSAAMESLRQIGTASPQAELQIQQLAQSENVSVATTALRCLVMLSGPDNDIVHGAVPRLVGALADLQPDVRNEAAMTLVEIGADIVPEVSVAFASPTPLVRLKACEIMAAIGPAAQSAVPALVDRLQDENELVIRAAARALGRITAQPDIVLPALQILLKHPAVSVRITALRAIGEYGTDAVVAVPSSLIFLTDQSPVLRASAAETLGRIGDSRSEVIIALVNALADQSAAVTMNAANALSQLGAPAVPSLLLLLADAEYRQLAVEMLGEMGVAAESAVPALLELLTKHEDTDEELRREVFIALGSIGPRAAIATPAMMRLLDNPEAGDARAGAAYVLARIGERSALPALKAILASSENETLLRSAAWATVALEPENKSNAGLVMPYLLRASSSEMPLVRREVMTAFATLGPEASAALSVLLEHAAGDSDASVRAMSLNALTEIHAPAAQVIPIAIVALEDPDGTVRNAARYLLGRLGPAAMEAAARLRESVRRGDTFERILSAWALVQVDPSEENREAAIPLMLTAMRSPNPGIRAEIATTLGTIGKQSPDVRAALEAAQADPNPMVKKAVSEALENLNGAR